MKRKMKVVILAGGRGTRLAEETEVIPKPMVEIGGRPILWHIMKICANAGCNEFVVAVGYKGEIIKRYFLDYCMLSGNIRISLSSGSVRTSDGVTEKWGVTLVDTGMNTNTGGRVRRLRKLLNDGTFMVTYGDGVADIDIRKVLKFHRAHGKIATITAVRPPARFGAIKLDGDRVAEFSEKSQIDEGWINGGFLVFEPAVFDYLTSDASSLECDAIEKLAADRQLTAYRHYGFWQCMDTQRDKMLLQKLWQDGRPPWRVWE